MAKITALVMVTATVDNHGVENSQCFLSLTTQALRATCTCCGVKTWQREDKIVAALKALFRLQIAS